MRGGEIRDPGITVFLVCRIDQCERVGGRKRGDVYPSCTPPLRNTETIPQLLVGVVFPRFLFPLSFM